MLYELTCPKMFVCSFVCSLFLGLKYTEIQLLKEVEHDIKNYQGFCLCYLLSPSVSVDNTNLILDNAGYHVQLN